MNSIIQYNGLVQIKRKVGHNKYIELFSGHNAGDDNLFRLITKFLAKQRINDIDLPALIDIKDNGKSILKNQLVIDSTATKETFYQTQMMAVLYSTNLTTDPSTSTSLNYDVLLTDTQSNILAQIQVPTEVFYRLQAGMQLIITWKLQISNANSGE